MFVVIAALLINNLIGPRLKGYKVAKPSEAIAMINHEEAVVVDVRESNEFSNGHIINSIHMPLGTFKDKTKDLEKYKDKPIIVSCRSGSRSAAACGMLKKAGFENVYNLSGGVMAWQSANLPLVKK